MQRQLKELEQKAIQMKEQQAQPNTKPEDTSNNKVVTKRKPNKKKPPKRTIAEQREEDRTTLLEEGINEDEGTFEEIIKIEQKLQQNQQKNPNSARKI